MSCFLSLTTLAEVQPPQIGESASLLHRVQQSGQSVPATWVIPAAVFQQTLHKLVAREPLFADWPQLLWQNDHLSGYSTQQIARRLHRPLLNSSLALPWEELLEVVDSPVVRLIPSLWCGEGVATIPWAQMLEAPYCWTEPEALEAALKRLWLSALDAKSLAFWQQWRSTQSHVEVNYPAHVALAVMVQSVEAAIFSGTSVVRSEGLAIAAVEGLPLALAECCPTTFEGAFPRLPHFLWESGIQEPAYTPSQLDAIPSSAAIESCLSKATRSLPKLTVPAAIEQQLWSLTQWFKAWSDQPMQFEWSLQADNGKLQITQLHTWPLRPYEASTAATTATAGTIAGRGAAPGIGRGRALILSTERPLPPTAQQQIIVATEVAPEWLPLLKTASGVISERGGLTCHAAVLARELGLPAVVGVQEITQHLRDGQAIEVDGDRGLVTQLTDLPSAVAPPTLPELSLPPTQTEIWINLSQPEPAAAIASLPVAGVGLLRSEWLMLPVLDRQHPYHWLATGQRELLIRRLMRQLRPILHAFAPRPVRYRTLDIRTSEFAQLIGAPTVEPNPMLGMRGAFSYYHHPNFFLLELELLQRLQAEGYGNLQLLLPFVRTVEEVTHCYRLIETVGLNRHADFALWMMAEVPSVLFLLPQYVAAGIQGIAIGTHDLTQLILGVDRDQAIFSAPYNETHPAVQAAIAQLIQAAQRAGIDSCLCGTSPTHHPEFIATAVQQTVTGISVDVAALGITAQIVQQAEQTNS